MAKKGITEVENKTTGKPMQNSSSSKATPQEELNSDS
jgi:hypothetical protein